MESREIIGKMEKEDRLLSESAVMKAVQKALIEMGYEPLDNRVMGVYKAIENTPTANDWITCSERLPADDREVLVMMSDDSMMVDFRTASSSGWFWSDIDDMPLAWQPLPAPYQPKGE